MKILQRKGQKALKRSKTQTKSDLKRKSNKGNTKVIHVNINADPIQQNISSAEAIATPLIKRVGQMIQSERDKYSNKCGAMSLIKSPGIQCLKKTLSVDSCLAEKEWNINLREEDLLDAAALIKQSKNKKESELNKEIDDLIKRQKEILKPDFEKMKQQEENSKMRIIQNSIAGEATALAHGDEEIDCEENIVDF